MEVKASIIGAEKRGTARVTSSGYNMGGGMDHYAFVLGGNTIISLAREQLLLQRTTCSLQAVRR